MSASAPPPKPSDEFAAPANATIRISGSPSAAVAAEIAELFGSRGGKPRRTVPIAELFGLRRQLVVGRDPSCDVVLPHPSVSRRHALLERVDGTIRLTDLGSVNGVWVGGRRIDSAAPVAENVRVGIGPFLFCLEDGEVRALAGGRSLRLEAHALEKLVPGPAGRPRKLLDNIHLAIEPGEFVSLLGPSGCGKSTLMDCLNGRRPATGGRLLANGEDFYRHFDNFRQLLGYVPQKDIVHTQLSVRNALYYTARLRLPTDTDRAELHERIEEVLSLMELGPHRDTLVGNLSGGQIKRVSLGAELLARPAMLFIDEATSGLDAGTEARMMRLFRTLADEGKSVLCITHNVDNVDLCHLLVVLIAGRLVFYGPPAEARAWFGIPRISELYDRLAERSAVDWERDFAGSDLHKQFVADRLAAPAAPPSGGQFPVQAAAAPESATDKPSEPGKPAAIAPAPPPAIAPAETAESIREKVVTLPWHQYRVLTARNFELLWRDARNLRLLLMQAPIVAAFVLLGFLGKPFRDEVPAPRRLTAGEKAALEKLADDIEAARPQVAAAWEGLDPDARRAAMLAAFLAGLDEDRLASARSVADLLTPQMLRKLAGAPVPVVPDGTVVNPRFTYVLLFLLVFATLWFGCNNAAKEIVKEEAIYGRERAVNLGILPYLAAKFTVLAAVCAVQVALLMGVVYGALEGSAAVWGWAGWESPEPAYRLDYPAQAGVLFLLSLTGVAMGLVLSACVSNPDRAATLLPYALVPQIILGGAVIPVNGGALMWVAMTVAPTYWAWRAVRTGETAFPADFPGRAAYDDSLWLPCAALAGQMLVLLLLTAWFLKRKDPRRA